MKPNDETYAALCKLTYLDRFKQGAISQTSEWTLSGTVIRGPVFVSLFTYATCGADRQWVVVGRGSNDTWDWVRNLWAMRATVGHEKKMHAGFRVDGAQVRQGVKRMLETNRVDLKRTTWAGHSKAGPLAEYLQWTIDPDQSGRIVTFGAPRWANGKLAETLTGARTHYAFMGDPVVRMPVCVTFRRTAPLTYLDHPRSKYTITHKIADYHDALRIQEQQIVRYTNWN